MQTSMNDQANQWLARAWALLDRAEHLARQAVRDETAGPSLVAPGGQQHPARPRRTGGHPPGRTSHGVDALPDGNCRDLVRAAVEQLASIPQGHEPAGLSLALVHLAEAEHEVGGRFCP